MIVIRHLDSRLVPVTRTSEIGLRGKRTFTTKSRREQRDISICHLSSESCHWSLIIFHLSLQPSGDPRDAGRTWVAPGETRGLFRHVVSRDDPRSGVEYEVRLRRGDMSGPEALRPAVHGTLSFSSKSGSHSTRLAGRVLATVGGTDPGLAPGATNIQPARRVGGLGSTLTPPDASIRPHAFTAKARPARSRLLTETHRRFAPLQSSDCSRIPPREPRPDRCTNRQSRPASGPERRIPITSCLLTVGCPLSQTRLLRQSESTSRCCRARARLRQDQPIC